MAVVRRARVAVSLLLVLAAATAWYATTWSPRLSHMRCRNAIRLDFPVIRRYLFLTPSRLHPLPATAPYTTALENCSTRKAH